MIAEYNSRKDAIKNLEKETALKQAALDKHQADIEDVKVRWLEPLKTLISKINENFGRFFRSMNCAGEVDLNVPANPVSISLQYLNCPMSHICLVLSSVMQPGNV